MDVFVYYFQPLDRGRDEIEDDLVDSLSAFGCEVTGSGAGQSGGNFDLLFSSATNESDIIAPLAGRLASLGFAPDTMIRTDNIAKTIVEILA